MKKILLSILLAGNGYCLLQAQSLYGYVWEQNSGKKPVEGVKVKSTFGANQVTTTKKGDYTLTFQDAKPGKSVILVVEKDDWVITDKDKLETNLPEDAFRHPHAIILCRRDVWEKQNKDFKTLLENYIRKSYDREKAALSKQDKQYQAIIDSLQEKYTSLEKNLGQLAEVYSKTNLDELSEAEKKAYALFKEGRIDECIELRKSLDSENNLKKTKSREKQLDSLDKQLDKARAGNKKEMEMHVRNLKEEARLAEIKYDFATAEKKFHFLAVNDSADINNLFDYATFLFSIGKDDEAISWYNRILTADVNESDRASTKDQMGLVYKKKKNFKAAEEMYLEALQVFKRLAQTDPATYDYHVSMVLTNLGSLMLEKNNFTAAETDLLEALEIKRRINQLNHGNGYGLAVVLINLGNLYIGKGDYPMVEKTLLEALEIYENLSAADENDYKPDRAILYTNLGGLYYKINNPARAEYYFLEALKLKRALAKNNPAAYEPDLADILLNLSTLYAEQNNYSSAEKPIQEAYEIVKQLVAENPGKYESNMANILNNRGMVYVLENNYQAAEEAYLQSLKIRRQLVKDNPDVYERDIATSLSNLGRAYDMQEKYDAAWKAYNESMEIRRRLARINPEANETELADILTNMGALYYKQRNYAASEKVYLESVEIRERWSKKNPAAFQPGLAPLFYNLGLLYQDKNDFRGSLQMFTKAANSFDYCVNINAARYELSYYRTVLSIADLYLEYLTEDNITAYLPYSRKADSLFQKYPASNNFKYAKSIIDSGLNDPAARTMYGLRNKKNQLPIGNEKNSLQEQLIDAEKRLSAKSPGIYATGLANDLGNFAWDLLFDKQFAKAENMTLSALNPTIDNLPANYTAQTEWINKNLALALLFQNKYGEAEKIYLLLKDKTYAGTTYGKIFLADLDEMEKAGITNKNVKKIRDLLKN